MDKILDNPTMRRMMREVMAAEKRNLMEAVRNNPDFRPNARERRMGARESYNDDRETMLWYMNARQDWEDLARGEPTPIELEYQEDERAKLINSLSKPWANWYLARKVKNKKNTKLRKNPGAPQARRDPRRKPYYT